MLYYDVHTAQLFTQLVEDNDVFIRKLLSPICAIRNA